MARFSVRPNNKGGGWAVVDTATGSLVETYPTNRGAWYAADKLNREATSRSQVVSEWAFTKKANDE
jgi:hypothetical protein